MKVFLHTHIAILLLVFISGVGLCGCKSPEKSPAHKNEVTVARRLELDKAGFLKMIDTVSHTLAKSGDNAQKAIDLINAYHGKYKFTINDQKPVLDTGNVFVNIANRQQSLFIMFGLAQNFRRQFALADFIEKFGEGKVELLPAEPVDIPVYFIVDGADKHINVIVRCKKLPNQRDNEIYDVTVSPM